MLSPQTEIAIHLTAVESSLKNAIRDITECALEVPSWQSRNHRRHHRNIGILITALRSIQDVQANYEYRAESGLSVEDELKSVNAKIANMEESESVHFGTGTVYRSR